MFDLPQWLINSGLGILSGVFGWWAKTIWDSLRILTKEVSDLEKLVIGKYVTNEVYERRMEKFETKIDQLHVKLDVIADRMRPVMRPLGTRDD